MSIIERERAEEVTREVTEADVLERAAYLLDEEIVGWHQGCLAVDRKGHMVNADKDAAAVCGMGAIVLAADDLGTHFSRAWHRLADEFPPAHEGAWHPFAAWNDTPGRTKAEVIAKLREAAAQARA